MRRATNLVTAVRALVLYALTTSLCGCAVLTVDVDMYKGPLSNHEVVQEEQIKAMIIGAKPVLAALRNDLEECVTQSKARMEPSEIEKPKGDVKPERVAVRVPPRYEHCFWPRPEDPCEWLHDADAIRVNAVLSLYCDATPAELETHVSRIRAPMHRIAAARDILEPSAERDGVLWRRVSANLYDGKSLGLHPAMKHTQEERASVARRVDALAEQVERLGKENAEPQEGLKSLLPDEGAKAARQREIDANRKERARLGAEIQRLNREKKRLEDIEGLLRAGYDRLEQGYNELLAPLSAEKPYRWIGAIAQGHNQIVEAYAGLPELSKEAPFPSETMADDANAQFDSLRGADVVTMHLGFLSQREPDRKAETEVVRSVNGIAAAFLDSRRDLEETLRVTLDLVDCLASRSKQSVDERRHLRATTRFALSLVKCGALAAALEKPNASPAVDGLRRRLSKVLDGWPAPETKWNDATIRSWKDALFLLFEEDPGETSRQLLAAHVSFMSGAYDVPAGRPYEKYKTRSSRRFGICLASPEREGADVLDEVLRSHGGWVESISGAAGLERGRLAQGLETLIDDCLKMGADLPPRWCRTTGQQQQLSQVESRLAAALIGFGEKVLVIANYDTLLRGPEKTDQRQSARRQKETEQRIRRYTDVLQAVGNSIIVQANELSAKAEHDEKLSQAGKRESRAIAYAFAQRIAGSDTEERTQKNEKNAGGEPNKPSPTPSARTASEVGGGTPDGGKTLPPSPNAPVPAASAGGGAPQGANQPTEQKAKEVTRAQPARTGVPPRVDPNFLKDLVAESRDAREALDNLIAVLRYEYAAEVKTSGPDSNEARNTAAALQTLYEQRADMVYIRPSSAYLRSSYPAASLQRDPQQTGSQNMLLESLTSEPLSREEQRTIWDIDKQYWQNVNQIRVSAAGSSNYVVAKDDVGNWYIKGYSSDPNCIIQGARSAALLAGASTGAIASATDLTTVRTGDRPASQTPSTSRQVEQIKEIDEAYREQLRTDIHALVKDVNGLAAQIRSRWRADPDTQGQMSKHGESALKDPNNYVVQECRKLESSADLSEAQRLVAMFKAIRRFSDKVDLQIAGLSLDAGEKSETIKRKARDTAKRTVCDFLLSRIERRTTTIRHQEMVLLVLGTNQGKTGQ